MNSIDFSETRPEIPATALLVDLRNFTPNLNLGHTNRSGVNEFCEFLGQFYSSSLSACRLAVPPDTRTKSAYYVNSTGDGVLAVFLNHTHFLSGLLAAICLHKILKAACSKYNAERNSSDAPPTSFGIGVESGVVSLVKASYPASELQDGIETYIGNCINIAARAEAVSKLINKAHTIVGECTNELCCQALFRESYSDLVSKARRSETTDKERLKLYDRVTNLNRQLCLAFLETHLLKGVTDPVALFKVGDRSIQSGNPRLLALIKNLTLGCDQHYAEIIQLISSNS